MAKYRKKPVVIEAVRWTGKNASEIIVFIALPIWKITAEGRLFIKTLEGSHEATVGDMIIKGVKGEFYPCKPDIFVATYDAVEESVTA